MTASTKTREWNSSELALLTELRGDGDQIRDISLVLSRSENEVRRKILELKLPKSKDGGSPPEV
jgi:hypothetical protein